MVSTVLSRPILVQDLIITNSLTFFLEVAGDSKRVGSERCLDLGVDKVHDMSIIFDHVDFLYPLDAVHGQFL